MTKDKKKVASAQKPINFGLLIVITNIIHAIGIPGAIVAFFMFIILVWGTPDQKREIIDNWVLFKTACQNQMSAIIVVFATAIVMILQYTYFHNRKKLDKLEIERLSKTRTELQEYMIGKSLHTSKK